MIKRGPQPVVTSCGCWLWCDSCKGAGRLSVFMGGIADCPDCKGKPATLKMCPAHAKGANWEIEKK